MVCAQLMAFGRVSQCREEGRERKRLKEELALTNGKTVLNGETKNVKSGKDLPNGPTNHVTGGKDPPNGFRKHWNGAGLRKIPVVRKESYFD